MTPQSVTTTIGRVARLAVQSFIVPDERGTKHALGGAIEQACAATYAVPVVGGALDLLLVAQGDLGSRGEIRHAITGTIQVITTGTLIAVGGWAGVLPAMLVGAVIAVPNFVHGRQKMRPLLTSAAATPRAERPPSRYADQVRAGDRLLADVSAPDRAKLVRVFKNLINDATLTQGWGEYIKEWEPENAEIVKKLHESGRRAGTLPGGDTPRDPTGSNVFYIFANTWVHVIDHHIYMQSGPTRWKCLGLAPLSKTLGTV